MTEQDDINALPVIPNDLRNLLDLMNQAQAMFTPFLRQAGTAALADAPGAGGMETPNWGLVAGDLNSLSLGSGSLAAMFFGQSNLLQDPMFEQIAGVTYLATNAFPTAATTDGKWKFQRVQNSGTGMAQNAGWGSRTRIDALNPFNSALLSLSLPTNIQAADNTVYLWPATDFDGANQTALPYLVATVKIGQLVVSPSFTNVTSATVRLQLMNVTDGLVVAEGATLDFKAMAYPEQRQLVAAYQADAATFQSKVWRWRVRVDIVATGSGGSLSIGLGEPTLRFAYAPEGGGPHTPTAGDWYPTGLRQQYESSTLDEPLIRSIPDLQTAPSFEVDANGLLQWGDEAGGGLDADFGRIGAGIVGSSGTVTAATLDGGMLRLLNTNDVSLASTNEPFRIGSAGGVNLAMDGNEIMARNNGATAALALNAEGGKVSIGVNVSPTTSAADGIQLGADVTLFRGGTDVLATEDHFRLDSGRLRFASVISPAQLTANQDNWNPSNLATANTIRIQTDATPRTITGIVAGSDGDRLTLHNRNSGTAITLAHDVTSTAANRFYCPGAANFSLQPKQSVTIQYSSADSRWLVIA